MEKRKRKTALLEKKICRFCLSQDGTLNSLYGRSRTSKTSLTGISLELQILSSISVEVFPSDGMPSYICECCSFFMSVCYKFKELCRAADKAILQYVQNDEALVPIGWSNKLLKLFYMANQSKNKEDVNTLVTDGGALVEVISHSDSDDDDDENVYNIKIATDGSEQITKKGVGGIKVLNAGNKLHNSKEKTSSNETTEAVDSLEASDCWPCPECNSAFPLEQMLELHISQKHRQRTVSCNKCNEKFFSKYDMSTHQLTHSDEMPFECVACDKKFKRLTLLKRHERNRHSDMLRYSCDMCPASYLSEEERDAHQYRHPHYQGLYTCSLCPKKFHTIQAMNRHKHSVHPSHLQFACEYCTQRFSSGPKLAKHVRAHAGARAYPCRYCPKSFIKSHHYTRHLRSKHGEGNNSVTGPYGECDQYSCHECDETFKTQDELIYHSAIHATHNLICPLCEEKFDDVDIVTAHIKSHTEGENYSCSKCPLMFTVQEKLERHVELRHKYPQEISIENIMLGDSEEEEEEDDSNISIKEEGDHMVVELKKTQEFMLPNVGEIDENMSVEEESGADNEFTELTNVDTLAITAQEMYTTPTPPITQAIKPTLAPTKLITTMDIKTESETSIENKSDNQTPSILRKAEEVKKTLQKGIENEKSSDRVEGSNLSGSNDKTLRLLEKELRELQRTKARVEKVSSGPSPSVRLVPKQDAVRARRPQLHTSTPKPKSLDKISLEEKIKSSNKLPNTDRRLAERRPHTKEPKDKVNNNTSIDEKENETEKNVTTEDSADDTVATRRSTRPSKVKDYAKMVRSRSSDESNDDDDEEYSELNKSLQQSRVRQKKVSVVPKPPSVPVPGRKRGRPRKDANMPPKISKLESTENKEPVQETQKVKYEENELKVKATTPVNNTVGKEQQIPILGSQQTNESSPAKSQEVKEVASSLMLSPTGQTFRKVPMQSLPPGVKPLPLPPGTRSNLCKMQIGKKLVKVQKIVMSKADVEAMTKKGLLEMKDGAMVLKQGINPAAIKSTLAADNLNESQSQPKDKGQPTRCELDEETTE